MNLKIGDPESIKARDAGRLAAWKEHFEKKIGPNLQCPVDGCPDCNSGPTAYSLHDVGIRWVCSMNNRVCSHCDREYEYDHFWSDFKGNITGWPAEPGEFDPSKVKE